MDDEEKEVITQAYNLAMVAVVLSAAAFILSIVSWCMA